LNCTHQLLACTDDIILGGSLRTINVNAKYSVMASTEFGPDVNVDKTEYMVTYRGQNAGRSDSVKNYNNSLEN
jgi:hypothetical protein